MGARPKKLSMIIKRLSFISALWMTVFGTSASAVEVTAPLSVSLAVPELVLVDFPNGGSTEIDLQITADCATDSGVCMLGAATIDFVLYGNSQVDVRARPERGMRPKINRRRLGLFNYATDPGADVPRLYYDVRFEMVDQDVGEAGFSMGDVESPDLIMLDDITSTKHVWRRRTDLSTGAKLGRIYVQPIFDGGSTLEDLNLAAPGIYTASLELLVTTR